LPINPIVSSWLARLEVGKEKRWLCIYQNTGEGEKASNSHPKNFLVYYAKQELPIIFLMRSTFNYRDNMWRVVKGEGYKEKQRKCICPVNNSPVT
jgi:hypothetical protein